MTNSNHTRTLVSIVLLAAVTVGTWAAWLGWETGYRTDPQTGSVSGPYSWWQVAGCVLTLIVVAAVAGRWVSPFVVVPVVAGAFTVAWSARASSSDETGLWGVGAILVLIGTAAGAALVVGASRFVLHHGR